MLILLTACSSVVQGTPGLSKDTDTGVADTDTGTTETAETGETADTVPTTDTFAADTGVNPFDCGALTKPLASGTIGDTRNLMPLLAFDQEGVGYAVTRAVELRAVASGSCDPLLVDGSGRTILSGDCTTAEGHVYAGFMTAQAVKDGLTYHFEDFSFTLVSADGNLTFVANGDVSWNESQMQEVDLHYTLTSTGTSYPGNFGEFIRNQSMTRTRLGRAGSGYLSILASDTLTLGELCFVADYVQDETVCGIEAYGTANFVGDHVMDVVFDGDVACDGCANLTVDGVDQGNVCP